MISRKTLIRSFAAGTLLASAALLPGAASAALPAGLDPAHHSTDASDPDPAHHRPYLVFSASTGDFVLTPVAGFDLNGYPLGGGGGNPAPTQPPAGWNYDPAHHSTDLNDADPAHHQPYWIYDEDTNEWRLVPIPGFDLKGNRVAGSTFS